MCNLSEGIEEKGMKKGMKKGQYLCIPYPSATTMQPTAPKEDPYAIPPSNNELFRKSKEGCKKAAESDRRRD